MGELFAKWICVFSGGVRFYHDCHVGSSQCEFLSMKSLMIVSANLI